jgi:DNA-binding response OmpR family regulator
MNLTPLQNLNVLHVEDDLAQARLFEKTLEFFFNRVYHAVSGVRAFEMLERLSVHVVFLDIRMPDMDGLTIAARIREKDSDIPLVVMTAHQDVSELRRAAALLLTDYLVKPVSLETLEAVLKKCVDQLNLRGRLRLAIGNDAYYDPSSKCVHFPDGRYFRLSRRESSFLELLLKRPGNLVPIDRIENVVYDGDMSLAALCNMVLRLRNKLGPAHRIDCVKEIGYTWQPPAEA